MTLNLVSCTKARGGKTSDNIHCEGITGKEVDIFIWKFTAFVILKVLAKTKFEEKTSKKEHF